MRTRRVIIVVAGVAAVVLVTSALLLRAAGDGSAPRPLPPASAPSIVLILTDDQRWDTLAVMPTVERELAARGVTFSNGFVVNSLCCPSRASILTGQYSHSTGVYLNTGKRSLPSFDADSTIATWLHEAGYRTGLFGKYLNGYNGTDVPPGWDRWLAFTGSRGKGRQPNYFGYDLSDDGELRSFGRSEKEYSTDVLARAAVSFIRGSQRPFFLYFAPYAPHEHDWRPQVTDPAVPAPRHAGSFRDVPPWRPPSYDEPDVSDKPKWLREHPRLMPAEVSSVDALRRTQLSSLLAVDEAVGDILDALRETGRLENTLLVFTSDNGQSWGEHRWRSKGTAYEENIRVPFVVRYDALLRSPRTDNRFVLNIDLAPTIADLAGVEAADVEGRSLLPLLTQPATPWRSDFLVEHLGDRPVTAIPTYCGVRGHGFSYVQYDTGEEELYDLRRDPRQLSNRAGDPAFRGRLEELRGRLTELCDPPPPDFEPKQR